MDNLARNAMLAKQAGMSYGKWKALHFTEQPKTDEEKTVPDGWLVCQYCGKPFKPAGNRKGQKFCEYECRRQSYYETHREEILERNRGYKQKKGGSNG